MKTCALKLTETIFGTFVHSQHYDGEIFKVDKCYKYIKHVTLSNPASNTSGFIQGVSYNPPGFRRSVAQEPNHTRGMRACQWKEYISKFWTYLTNVQYVPLWWLDRRQSCNLAPAYLFVLRHTNSQFPRIFYTSLLLFCPLVVLYDTWFENHVALLQLTGF